MAVAAQIALADVIAPENQDIGLAVGHRSAPDVLFMLKMNRAVGICCSAAVCILTWRFLATSA
jgi:hypothetical protein